LIAGAVSGERGEPELSVLQNVSSQTRLLVVAPHPDDETIAAGLLIQRVRAAGGEVRILLLTPGDNNPWPQRWLERRVRIRAPDRARWGERRRIELHQALARLDLPTHALHTMDWPDLGVTDLLHAATDAAVSGLTAAVDAFAPNLILIPALTDSHPDHGAAHVLMRLALANRVDPPPLFAYLIHGRPSKTAAAQVMPTSSDNQRTKLAAVEAHQSQMALSGRRMRHLASRPELYLDVRSKPLAVTATALPWQPPAWLQPLLRLSVVSRSEVREYRWSQAPLRRDDQGVYHLTKGDAQAAPWFVRLTTTVPSPWIFDHWGWIEL